MWYAVTNNKCLISSFIVVQTIYTLNTLGIIIAFWTLVEVHIIVTKSHSRFCDWCIGASTIDNHPAKHAKWFIKHRYSFQWGWFYFLIWLTSHLTHMTSFHKLCHTSQLCPTVIEMQQDSILYFVYRYLVTSCWKYTHGQFQYRYVSQLTMPCYITESDFAWFTELQWALLCRGASSFRHPWQYLTPHTVQQYGFYRH